VVAPVDDQPPSRKPRIEDAGQERMDPVTETDSTLYQKVFLPRKMHELRATAVDEVERYITTSVRVGGSHRLQ
jgi:hypothetical protein